VGLAVQAGSAPDVGIAGFLLSGGISWLARPRGLAVNDVLGIEVVGADGTARIVDHDHEPDVFWPSVEVAADLAWSPPLSCACIRCPQ
jgi:FAD/FMN-containing dehydrogenase